MKESTYKYDFHDVAFSCEGKTINFSQRRYSGRYFFITLFRMKRLLAICFLTIYIASATEISQLLRFPLLIEHYFEHKEKNPALSVVEFLKVHYNGDHLQNHPHDDDYDEDQRLPFMMHTTSYGVVFVCPPMVRIEIENRSLPEEIDNTPVRNDQFVDDTFLNSIWQPPKFC